MEYNELRMLQALPLDIKIAKTKLRIREWINHWGREGVYLSFSGGKDSTVLHHIIAEVELEMFGEVTIPRVFSDTGLEYPEIKQFIKTIDNVITIRPKLTFKQVIEKYGYPVVSKEQSHYIHLVRNSKSEVIRNKHLKGINRDGSPCQFTISKKWKYLIDAPFEISDTCCDVMKKRPFKKYEKETGRKPFIGTMAHESVLREKKYLNRGCNAFEDKRPISNPLGFWTEQDIYRYIIKYNIKIASIYGDLIVVYDDTIDKKYELTGVNRTGCMWCMFGVHLEKGENRFQKLKKSHPKIYDYCMNNLGLDMVLDYINVKH